MGEKIGNMRDTMDKQARDEHQWRESRRKAIGVDPLTGKSSVPSQQEVRKQIESDHKRYGGES